MLFQHISSLREIFLIHLYRSINNRTHRPGSRIGVVKGGVLWRVHRHEGVCGQRLRGGLPDAVDTTPAVLFGVDERVTYRLFMWMRGFVHDIRMCAFADARNCIGRRVYEFHVGY